jgi:hypothetical protein
MIYWRHLCSCAKEVVFPRIHPWGVLWTRRDRGDVCRKELFPVQRCSTAKCSARCRKAFCASKKADGKSWAISDNLRGRRVCCWRRGLLKLCASVAVGVHIPAFQFPSSTRRAIAVLNGAPLRLVVAAHRKSGQSSTLDGTVLGASSWLVCGSKQLQQPSGWKRCASPPEDVRIQ